MKAWQQLPTSVKLIAVALVIICVIDFAQRIYVAESDASRNFDPMAGVGIEFASAQASEEVKSWLQQRREEAEKSQQEQQVAVSEPKAALLEGGVNLGDMRVRVRGVYTASEAATGGARIALIDTQQIESRQVEITEISEGFELNGYTVSKINVNSVTFIGGDDESITIPVFDY
ncbi:hypothetical protein J6J08_06245 [Pseudidiomarina sp. 1APR75-33.1]|uniref:hypothetical protein n=1 Tax=Pseudidiomarina terrestris TaxID=2820060 RepID=UPI0026513C29|nr:hypothetical protein [Pseudidiomarina sp. 1APR75-33.1]MDN7126976.1 hypothetical protein [Pseudidiomarina sp. 1APR75-33.1]